MESGKELKLEKHSKFRILFLSDPESGTSRMAEQVLNSGALPNSLGIAAGTSSGTLHPEALAAMLESGFPSTENTVPSLAEIGSLAFDAVVVIGPDAKLAVLQAGKCSDSGEQDDTRLTSPLWIGDPTHIYWDIAEPLPPNGLETETNHEDIRKAFRWTMDEVQARVRSLQSHGYLEALITQRRQMQQVIDALDDGMVVHDQSRHIYLFNQAAERITGYRRVEVLGKKCHEIFPPDGICASQCQFTKGSAAPRSRTYELNFTTQKGEDRRLRVWVSPLPAPEGHPQSILALLRDVTEVSELRWRMKEKYSFHGMAGRSNAMQEVFRTIRQVTTSDYPVLITGESGTGKELVARAIHNESRRKAGPFVPINCGALPENILESELFGHVRGAFTGAIRDKKGRFELADKGTLFLDEIGELSPAFQVKLLRVLQDRRFESVGGEHTIQVDVRVCAATNRDLRQMVADGSFREDLFYRLAVVPIHIPPLRERREDLPLLVEQILPDIRQETGKRIRKLSDEALEVVRAFRWPGNVRELINALQFASVRCEGEEILPQHLPPEVRLARTIVPGQTGTSNPKRRAKLDTTQVAWALSETKGNRQKAARLLNVGRATLYRFLNRSPGL